MDAHIRVHMDWIELEAMIEYCKRYASRCILVKELEASRDHYQAYVRFKDEFKNLESLRNLLRIRLKGKGNKVYSISAQREDHISHFAYLLKECVKDKREPLLMFGVSPLDIKEAELKCVEYQKRQKMNSFERLAEDFKGNINDPFELATYLLREFKAKGKMVPDVYLMRKYVDTIRYIKQPEQFEKDYIRRYAAVLPELQGGASGW